MTRTPPPPTTPTTYDQIAARTVPDPDSSYRPTPEQLRDTAEGRQLATDDDELAARVSAALDAAGATGIEVEVRGGRATLHGAVPDVAAANLYEGVARGVEGVTGVEDRLHVAPART